MSDQTLVPSPAQVLVEALDELSLVICRALGEHCPIRHAGIASPVPDIDAGELDAALARVHQSLRHYREHRCDDLHSGR
jgi:hypothetical protein